MKRRDGSGKPRKRRRLLGRKPRNAPADRASIADLQRQLDERTRDRDEALQQRAATAEILNLISNSPTDTQPVFKTMLAKAVELCEASFGAMWLVDGKGYQAAAMHGDLPRAYVEQWRGVTVHLPKADIPMVRAIRSRKTVHTQDVRKERAYLQGEPLAVSAADVGGIRTMVTVPMLKGGEAVGVIVIYRREVLPFTSRQVELVESFAAQAVIAIENARLLNELRESLQQQTATADVLKVISSSPGDLRPVFDAMLENAVRICEAAFGSMLQHEGGGFRRVALHNAPMDYEKYSKTEPFLRPTKTLAHILETRQTAQVADMAVAEPQSPITRLGGARTLLNVPMIKENELIGIITVFRQEVRPFSDKQIELVKNFAAQAVIAIENTRLLSELRQRTAQIAKLNAQLEQRVSDQVGEIERMSRLRRFLPPQVADLIVASGTEKQLQSHRREITALFCDLRGFTGFSESSDPEDVMALLRDYHAAIGEIIIKYSGTLERYAGDGVMVVFNDPVPVENPALQAVLMALEMRDAIGALTEAWHRWGHDIGFGIGIAHGFATLGTIGFEGRFDYAAIGTVSNVASRLCDEAKPGQILISPRVLTKVENAVAVEPVGEFALKGIRRPMMAYNVLTASPSKPN
jgi:adenylate cyclase